MSLRKRTWIAAAALVAVGAVVGAWITAKTGHFPFSVQQIPAAAQSAAAEPEISFKAGFGPLVKKVQPAVVSVTSKTMPRVSEQRRGQPILPNLPDGLREFFGDQFPFFFDIPQGPRRGLGSGVIVTSDGYIVTNNHVVDEADQVTVSLQDNREFNAKVVGKDAQSDIAVLKIEASGLPFISFGDSDTVQVGDIVLALGNPFGIGQTVTMGIVGATHRNTPMQIGAYEDFIQTDAAINPGNSGGALVNMKGELIGINTAILSRSGGNQGVGFAIPAKMAHNVMEQIIKHGKVSRGFLGVSIQPVNSDIAKQFKLPGEPRGALVGDVTPDSPADKAGIKAGDIITEINGARVVDSANLRVRVASLMPGTTARLKLYRDGQEREVSVVLGSQPGEPATTSSAGPANGDGPRLGVSVEPASRSGRGRTGLLITNVAPGSAADEAGLRPGDIILEVNRKPVSDPAEFQQMVRAAGNQSLLLYVESSSDRGTQRQTVRHFVTVQPR
jgi:serine protease Do